MHDASANGENDHIITASNVNKRLSFRGRGKFAEAFIQGKTSQFYAQLSQLDKSHPDEAISCSSSDGECGDSSSLPTRRRPNRTYASQINFYDCKRVRRGGRRHSSASFMRSIEKRPKGQSEKCSNSFTPQPSLNTDQADAHPGISDSATLRRESLIIDSDSLEEPVWAKNLSILNNRLNLTDSTNSLISTENLGDNVRVLSPKANLVQEIIITSPILGPRDRQSHRRRPSTNCNKSGRELNAVEDATLCESDSTASSPIFKISSRGRRSVQKPPKSPKLGNNSPCRGKEPPVTFGLNGQCTFLNSGTVLRKDTDILSLQNPKKGQETPMSPVIGNSAGKRRKPTRMMVDKLVSPILGSKATNTHPLKIQKLASERTSMKLPKGSIEKCMDQDLNTLSTKKQTLHESPISDLIMLNEAQIGVGNKQKLLTTQFKTTVKRTLDFSSQTKLEQQKDPDKILAAEFKNAPLPSQYSADELKSEPLQRMKINEKDSKECNLSFSCSHFIEECNSEPVDYLQEKTDKTPTHQQKKKKLSLSWKKSPRKISHHSRINIPLIPAATKPLTNSTLSMKPHIHSLLIEEEFSEPMEAPRRNDFDSPVSLHKPGGSSSKKIVSDPAFTAGRGVFNQQNRKNNEDDVNIDSCSSPSSDASQQLLIEKLPSSSVSSPVTISQTSSPPAVAAVCAFAVEKSTDDFNEPPRKGKTKLKPDGLANRLQRLLNRQRSSSRIWQFQRSKQSKATLSSGVDSDQSPSMLLIVERTWTEYSHVIVQGCVDYDCNKEAVVKCLGSYSKHVIVVLDPFIAKKLGKIMLASKLRIFPPWQALKLRGISLILCAYCIEVIISASLLPKKNQHSSEKEGTASLNDGISLSDIIFPKVVEKSIHLFQYTEALAEESTVISEGVMNVGTISTLVSHHYVGEVISGTLNLTILRVFQFYPTDSVKSNDNCFSWALLGQDTTGEVCEIVLGYEQPHQPKGDIWKDIESGEVIGKTYNFKGFQPVQRISPFRVSNLWRVVSSMGVQGQCDQPVLYVLYPANVSWECRLSRSERKKNIYQPSFSTLTSILSEISISEPSRVNIVCRILHATKERLYVTDAGSSPSIIVISVSPAAYQPSLIFKAAVLAVCDLEVVSVTDLRIDKYSRMFTNKDKNVSFIINIFNEDEFCCLAGLNPTLPVLQRNTQAKSLAMFFGTVDGVDEESAYMWPACGICENELLSLGGSSERYCCEKCNGQCENFILRMSLQVLCKSPNLPSTSSVRLKLLQITIESLLPPTLCGEEGYDMNAVIGQKLGPLRCEVLHANDGNFTLQELPEIDVQ